MVVAFVSLGIGVITLFFALLIHSETRDALGRINAITDTLPGAYDAKRLIKDIEKTKTRRGRVVCDVPKNTHIDWEQQSGRKVNDCFWRFWRKAAVIFSSDIYESRVESSEVRRKWEIISRDIGGQELEASLLQGWEPFSVTSDDKVWLRKGVVVKDKSSD